MKKAVFFVAFVTLVAFAACGGGGGGTSDPGTTPDVPVVDQPTVDQPTVDQPTVDQPVTDQPVTDQPVVMGTFKGNVIEFGSKPPKGIEGADVEVYDQATGTGTGIKAKSGKDGALEIQAPKGTTIGLKVSMAGYRDTYQFGIASEAAGETVWIVSELTYKMAPAMAGLTVDESKGILAGSIYFMNADKEEHVGCATVKTDPAGEARYFDPLTGYPAKPEKAPTTSKDLAYFVVANIPAGKAHVSAMVKNTEVGAVDIFSYAKSICIQNIYVTTATNPTPADCAL